MKHKPNRSQLLVSWPDPVGCWIRSSVILHAAWCWNNEVYRQTCSRTWRLPKSLNVPLVVWWSNMRPADRKGNNDVADMCDKLVIICLNQIGSLLRWICTNSPALYDRLACPLVPTNTQSHRYILAILKEVHLAPRLVLESLWNWFHTSANANKEA